MEIKVNNLVKRVFKLATPGALYLVGGYVRDLINNAKDSKDIDFIVKGDHHKFACTVADHLDGKPVKLKEALLTRVMRKGGISLDFTPMQGDTLRDDLLSRDFRMNAIAWSPGEGLIDPNNGIGDIHKRRISAISENNLLSDPLRILRAYRFQANLGWNIANNTRTLLRQHSEMLNAIAHERLTQELVKLLSTDEAPSITGALKRAVTDGVLAQVIFNENRVLTRNIKLISNISGKLNEIPQRYLKREFQQELTFRSMLLLEILMLGAEGHRLALSREALRRIRLIDNNVKKIDSHSTPEQMFRVFTQMKDEALDALIIGGNIALISELLRYWKIDRSPILSSTEIMNITDIKGGKELGVLLMDLKLLEFKGNIRNSKQATLWLKARNAI